MTNNGDMSAARTDAEAERTQATSGITPESLQETLERELDASKVDIVDMSGGCGQMYEAVIVSAKFEGKARLARHRMVNAAVREQIKAIHAWTPKCLTPREWEKERGGGS